MNSVEKDLSIVDILSLMFSHKLLILIFIIITISITFVKVAFFTDDVYVASGILYVSNQTEGSIDSESISKGDIESSRTLGSTYMEVLKTRSFLEEVSQDVDNKYSWNQIKNMTTISAVNQTELLSVTVKSTSAEDSYKIAESIISKAPDKLNSVFKRGEVAIVDGVLMPKSPVSKGLTKKLAIGAIVGAMLGIILVFLMSLFDKKIHKSEDIVQRYNISILGEL